MGNLTTFTIYNDELDAIEKDPQGFTDFIVRSACGEKVRGRAFEVIAQKYRHSSETTIYIQTGNTCTEINPYSKETLELMKNNEEFFLDLLNTLESNAKKLREVFLKQNKNKIND